MQRGNFTRNSPDIKRLALSVVAALLTLQASAQTILPADAPASEADFQLSRVEVTGKRAVDPAIIKTEFIYKIQNIVDQYADGLVSLRWRAFSRANKDDRSVRDGAPPPALKPGTVMFLDLANGEERQIRFDAEGYLQLPPLSNELAAKSAITTNQPKGTVGVTMNFKILPTVDNLTPEMVIRTNRALERINADIKQLLPWAMRWVLPTVNGLSICQSQSESPAQWRSSRGSHRIVYLYENQKKSQSCAVFHSLDGLPADARLEASPSSVLMPWITGWTGSKAK